MDPSYEYNDGSNQNDSQLIESYSKVLEEVINLKVFLVSAPVNFSSGDVMQRYHLPNDEIISCIYWNNVFYITGTDIVRCLHYRFEAFGRVVRNRKKFEEGVFSDLRSLKCNSDAILEEPKSKFLDFLYKHSCVRTQKKQKVFHWYSVSHDSLFLDALERDLKREAAGKRASTEAMGEPALSFKYDPSQSLSDQLAQIIDGIPKPLAAIADASTSNNLVSQYSHAAATVAQQQQNITAAVAAAAADVATDAGLPDSRGVPSSTSHTVASSLMPDRGPTFKNSGSTPVDDMTDDYSTSAAGKSHHGSSKFVAVGNYDEPGSVGLLDVGASYVQPGEELQYVKPDVDSDFPLDYFPAESASMAYTPIRYASIPVNSQKIYNDDYLPSSANMANIIPSNGAGRTYSTGQMQNHAGDAHYQSSLSSDYLVYVQPGQQQQLVAQQASNRQTYQNQYSDRIIVPEDGDYQDMSSNSILANAYVSASDVAPQVFRHNEQSGSNGAGSASYGVDYNEIIAGNGVRRIRKAPGYVTGPVVGHNRIAKPTQRHSGVTNNIQGSAGRTNGKILVHQRGTDASGVSNVGVGSTVNGQTSSDLKHYYPTPSDSGSSETYINETNDELRGYGMNTQYVYLGNSCGPLYNGGPAANFDDWTGS